MKVYIELPQRVDAALATDPRSESVFLLKQAISRVYNVNPREIGIGGGTIAAYLRKAGLNASVCTKTGGDCPSAKRILHNRQHARMRQGIRHYGKYLPNLRLYRLLSTVSIIFSSASLSLGNKKPFSLVDKLSETTMMDMAPAL